MTGHTPFIKLRAGLSPEAAAEASRKLAALRAEMPLHDIREAMRLSQTQLAETLGVAQPAIAKMERRTDMFVSTVRRFVNALGGELHITATFPEGTVEITNFREIEERVEVGAADHV